MFKSKLWKSAGAFLLAAIFIAVLIVPTYAQDDLNSWDNFPRVDMSNKFLMQLNDWEVLGWQEGIGVLIHDQTRDETYIAREHLSIITNEDHLNPVWEEVPLGKGFTITSTSEDEPIWVCMIHENTQIKKPQQIIKSTQYNSYNRGSVSGHTIRLCWERIIVIDDGDTWIMPPTLGYFSYASDALWKDAFSGHLYFEGIEGSIRVFALNESRNFNTDQKILDLASIAIEPIIDRPVTGPVDACQQIREYIAQVQYIQNQSTGVDSNDLIQKASTLCGLNPTEKMGFDYEFGWYNQFNLIIGWSWVKSPTADFRGYFQKQLHLDVRNEEGVFDLFITRTNRVCSLWYSTIPGYQVHIAVLGFVDTFIVCQPPGTYLFVDSHDNWTTGDGLGDHLGNPLPSWKANFPPIPPQQ